MARLLAPLAVLLAVQAARIQRKKAKIASACGLKGASAPSSQIVNGQPATEGEWRWQARLWSDFDGGFCGGTLIDPEWVLTAAHCVSKPDFSVILGAYNVSASSPHTQERKAELVFQHPKYDADSVTHDLAMVKLESPVELSDYVGLACLPQPGAPEVSLDANCWISGWGALKTGGRTPQVLQEAKVGLKSNEECVKDFDYTRGDIDSSMLCAQGKGPDGRPSDACQGDSGGPLVCEAGGQWTVYGATSWGYDCASAVYPGIWARVAEQLEWIQEFLEGNYATPPPPACPWNCTRRRCGQADCKELCAYCSA